jgi:hypothetical protein
MTGLRINVLETFIINTYLFRVETINLFSNLNKIICGKIPVLGAFAKLRKATNSCVMSVRPAHGTVRLVLDGFS